MKNIGKFNWVNRVIFKIDGVKTVIEFHGVEKKAIVMNKLGSTIIKETFPDFTRALRKHKIKHTCQYMVKVRGAF